MGIFRFNLSPFLFWIMKQLISINEFRIPVFIGVHEWEKKAPQELIFSIDLEVNVSTAFESDALIDTIDYTQIASICTEISQKKHFNLIEHLAFGIHKAIKLSDPKILALRLSITKPTVIPNSKAVVFTLSDW